MFIIRIENIIQYDTQTESNDNFLFKPFYLQRAISEEKRLACTIQLIDKDVAVVPRGAYHKDPTGKLAINPVFTGISPAEIGRLESYLHFNKNGLNVNAKTIAEKESNFDENVDILESIAKDEPKGTREIISLVEVTLSFTRRLE